ITGWSMTMQEIAQAAAGAEKENVVLELTPAVDAEDWATLGELPPTYILTITSKFPVNVTVTMEGEFVYGSALPDPKAEQAAINDGTDPEGEFTFTYEGVEDTEYPASEQKPVNAGT